MQEDAVLICTVGGSHQPIVTAIREIRPLFVCFLCTGKDPTTGQPGSRGQIEGKDNIIKASPRDPTPSLANIPTQADLPQDRYQVRITPADDLDGVVAEARDAIAAVRRRFPAARVLADYTGGTKTMTAGLVMAAMESEDVELRLVTGARGDLQQVHDGTESSAIASVRELCGFRKVCPGFSGNSVRFGGVIAV
jgi:hypothetical protein